MLYRYIGVCFLLYTGSLAAAASSNGSGVTSSNSSTLTSSSGSGAHRETPGKVSFSGSVILDSPVRPVPSPTASIVMAPSPDSPPLHTVLNLAAVGRTQSASSLASQLTDRYKRQLNTLVPLTPTDSDRLNAEFQQDIETYLPKVAATDVAAVLAIMPSGSSSLHTSSSDEETDGSSGKSSPHYVLALESIVEGLNRQLEVLTKVDTHNRLRLQEERQHRATEQAHWERERQRFELEQVKQRRNNWAAYGLTALGFVTSGVTAALPYFAGPSC